MGKWDKVRLKFLELVLHVLLLYWFLSTCVGVVIPYFGTVWLLPAFILAQVLVWGSVFLILRALAQLFILTFMGGSPEVKRFG